MSVILVYQPRPDEGPEMKQLGSPFNCTLQPGLEFACDSLEFARELVRRVPQVQVVRGAPYPEWPDEQPQAAAVAAEAGAAAQAAADKPAEKPKKKRESDLK